MRTQWDEARKELMIKSSVGTIGSWGFGPDELVMFTGKIENKPSFEVVLEGDVLLQKEGDEAIMHPVKELVVPTNDEEKELLQNEDEQLEEDETIMTHGQKLVAIGSRKELAC